jgi:MFS transporter, DHA1 family, multidrug resistance protein
MILYKRMKYAFSIRWQRTLLIVFIAQLMTAVGFSSIFPFLPLYVDSLGTITNLSVEFLAGMVFSAQAITMMIASPFWGALADRYGRKLMVERSMFGGSILLLLMAFVTSAEQLVLLRAVQGLITGTLSAANALIAAEVPRENSGYAMGLLQVGLGSGVALGPIIGGSIADAYGYSAAFFVTAAMLFISGLTVWLGVKENFQPSRDSDHSRSNFLAGWRSILLSPGVVMTYGMRFISQLGRMMIVPIAPLFIQTLLPDTQRVNTITGLTVGIAAGSTTISAIYLGKLGDRVGHRRIVIMSSFAAALLYMLQSQVNSALDLLVLQGLVGVAMGGIIPSISALLAKFTRAGEEGAVYGLDNSIDSGARSIAPLVGAGVALVYGLRANFVATGGLFFVAGLLALWRLPQINNTREKGE